MFKVNNENTRKTFKQVQSLQTAERRSIIFVVNFEHISHFFLLSPWLTLNE